jgi:hypothetical protein
MKPLAALLILGGCAAQPYADSEGAPTVIYAWPMQPICVFACEVRTSDGTTTILRPAAH